MARGAQIVMTIDSSDDESLDDDDPFRDNVTVFTPIMDNVDVALHLTSLFDDPLFADFETHCADGTMFQCHRAVLMRNQYFRNMLRSGMKEAKEHRAELPESSDIVQILLKEIYNDHRIMCDIHRLSFTETLELYFAANKYMMDRLKEEALPRANAFLDVGAMSMTEVLETIPRVYEETGDGDPLRREFVSWANNVQVKTSLLAHVKEKEALRKLFQEVPDFAMDLFAKWGA